MFWKLEYPLKQSTIPKIIVKILIAPKIGQGLKVTKWKGWLKNIIYNKKFYFVSKKEPLSLII